MDSIRSVKHIAKGQILTQDDIYDKYPLNHLMNEERKAYYIHKRGWNNYSYKKNVYIFISHTPKLSRR